MKKAAALIAALVLCISTAFADDIKGTVVDTDKESVTIKLTLVKSPKITVDGEEKVYSPKPFEESDRIFVPLRAILEDNGFAVNYDDETETIIAVNASTNDVLAMQLGNTGYSFNGTQYSFDVTPVLRNDRTFVPVRIMYEMLGYDVNYDEPTNTAIVTSK